MDFSDTSSGKMCCQRVSFSEVGDGAGELSEDKGCELCDQKTSFDVDGQRHCQEPLYPTLERMLKRVADTCGLMHYPASVFLFFLAYVSIPKFLTPSC